MGTAIVCTLNTDSEIIDEFKMDWNDAIATYWGKRLPDGKRYFVYAEGCDCPYKRRKKNLRDVRPQTT